MGRCSARQESIFSVSASGTRTPIVGAGAGRSEFLNDIRDDTLDFRRLEHDPERRMEALAAIAAAVSQEVEDRSR